MSIDDTETGSDIRRHELLADVAETTAQRLMMKHGLTQEQAGDIGNDLADFLSKHWGGQNIYLVKDEGFKLNQRDWEIYRRLKRGNAHELAREFNLSFVRIYQIHRRCLAVMRERLEPGLFGPDDGGLPESASTGTGSDVPDGP